MKLFTLTLSLFFLITAISFAQAKDSLDYMEDGEMTQEEMEEEAEFVAQNCFNHIMRNSYFDCNCVGGKFLIEREKQGPYVMQHDIETQIYTSDVCVDKPGIAGQLFTECMDFSRYFRQWEEDHTNYCSCAGNKMANLFGEYPALNMRHLRRLQSDSLVYCDNPLRR